LRELRAPRRNRYFEGRLLSAADFSLEQEYWLARERLLNRHVFGCGVVTGLGVTAVEDGPARGLRIAPGLAIDRWGRVIVVPAPHEVMPIALTDEDGSPLDEPSDQLPGRLVVSLCYQECPADLVRAVINEASSDCVDREAEATTWIETYAIRIREGAAGRVTAPCPDDVLEALRSGNLDDAVYVLVQATDAPLPEDPCLALANVSTSSDGALAVEQCAPRLTLPTNQILLALVACLAERANER
jgi:hypothetical protein